jgi:N4-gp56 family major capsid protein
VAGQLWAVSTQGQLLYSPLLSKEVTNAAQPLMKFKQFTDMKMEAGRGRGETFLFDKYGNIDTEGGTLAETSTIPSRSYRVYQGTGTLYEFGNSVPFTRKYEELAQVDARSGVSRILADDQAKVIDTTIEAQFDACKIRYNATSATTGTFHTNGTDTETNTSALNRYHVKILYDYLWNNLNAKPYFAGSDDYAGILSQNAMRGIFNDCETVVMYTEFPAYGEFGRYSSCRMTKTNHGLSNAIGNGSAYGEAYFFGANTVKEGIAVAPVVIPKEVTDYGRSRGLAWYAIMGYKIFWEGDPDNTIIKFGSA